MIQTYFEIDAEDRKGGKIDLDQISRGEGLSVEESANFHLAVD